MKDLKIKYLVYAVFLLLILTVQLLPKPAHAVSITFTDFQAVMASSVDPRTGNEIVSLLVASSLFGPGGFAGGLGAVGTTPDDGHIWLIDPFAGVDPSPFMPVLSFIVSPGGDVMGVEPSPFRLFTAQPPDPIIPGAAPTLVGELDFSGVTGTLGSLNLSGVIVHAVDQAGVRTGDIYDVAPFTIQAVAVPEPSTFLLLGFGLLGAAALRRRFSEK